ncbi:hypothetical protein EGW08_006999 [Elysia chlorotica]|uniref:Peptidase S1 domain-containing protein n=1 Tax=Elysia chlorotica TaxID=188477 RepID=A0A433TUR6_ELYCH|nr:hypothetical protein EGW08_006999 [Elysia chlorotica]
MEQRAFVPETQDIDLNINFRLEGTAMAHFPHTCDKQSNHKKYKLLKDLEVSDLPQVWQHEWALRDLKMIGRRVVHITVLRKSTLRHDWFTNPCHEGSGFLTLDPKNGPIVHTSKHVVLNPFEAENTVVRLFFDDDSSNENFKIIKWFSDRLIGDRQQEQERHDLVWEDQQSDMYFYLADERYFKSVMCSDYTSFAVDWRVQKHFSAKEMAQSDLAFSWRMASLKRISLGPQLDIDVAVVSHPHGMAKRVSFGAMKRLIALQPALYDAPTCGGSSGSPVVRLHPDSTHYISAGQFVHHGHFRRSLNLGMGTVRPPIAFPYIYALDVENVLVNAISVCYEPIFYWTLFVCDFMHIESTLIMSLDVFAYTSTLSALAFGVSSLLFRVLFCGFWLHNLATFLLHTFLFRWGPVRAASRFVGTMISMTMFLVSWLLLLLAPYPLSSVPVVVLVWLLVLFPERHFDLHGKFHRWFNGPFDEYVQFNLARERARQGWRERRHMDDVQNVYLGETHERPM